MSEEEDMLEEEEEEMGNYSDTTEPWSSLDPGSSHNLYGEEDEDNLDGTHFNDK